jgi:two-component system cell cycle sensor histidine kinase/response regulator CckA
MTAHDELPRSILIVDDDPQVRKLFHQVLNKAGYSVHDACNGLEAQALVQRVHFDVMILDLNMPEMDGFEVLKFARSALPALKIIVASGYMQGATLRSCLEPSLRWKCRLKLAYY